MTITFVIPSMRPNKVKRTLHDLNHQTLRPSRVILVDNSTRFVNGDKYDYELEIRRPKENLGTNPVWNIALRLKDDYCGILGDDYRLEPTMVEKFVFALHLQYGNSVRAGAVVPDIVQKKRGIIKEDKIDLSFVRGLLLGSGKGQCSAVLMKGEIARSIPLIPDDFKIFFGDNWIGYHIIHTLALGFVKVFPCNIYHTPGKDNVSASLNYKGTLKNERVFWNKFVRAEAERVRLDSCS